MDACMSIIILLSNSGYMALAGIYNHLPLISILCFLLSVRTSTGLRSFTQVVTHTFIPENFQLFIILSGLDRLLLFPIGFNHRTWQCWEISWRISPTTDIIFLTSILRTNLVLLWLSGSLTPPNTVILFLSWGFNRIRSPKWSRGKF